MPRVLPVLVQQQDRAKQAGKLGFHNPYQFLQYFLQRSITGYHLQNTALSVTQRLCPLAVGHVYRCTDVFKEIAGYVANGVTCRANVLNRSAWKNDSEIHVKVGAFVRPFKKDFSAYPVSILWMNALVKRFV